MTAALALLTLPATQWLAHHIRNRILTPGDTK